MGYNLYNVHESVYTILNRHVTSANLINEIFKYDNTLTLNASRAAKTGDLKYEQIYLRDEKKLTEALVALEKVLPDEVFTDYLSKTNLANDTLVSLEKQVFKSVRSGRLNQARMILISEQYQDNKTIYSAQMDLLRENHQTSANKDLLSIHDLTHNTIIIVAFVCVFLFFLWSHLTVEFIRHQSEAQEKIFEKEKMAAIGLNTAEIVHNIKNPLYVIEGYAKILEKKIEQGELLDKDSVAVILRQVRKLDEIVMTVLDSSQNIHNLEAKPVNLTEIIKNEIEVLDATKHHINIFLELESDLIIKGIPTHFSQLFGNLFQNAFDAMKKSEKKELRVKGVLKNDKVVINIVDTGEGIPSANLKKIFDPNFTTKVNDGSYFGGSGLGLTYCKRMVESYHGSINVESKIGQGTEITLELRVHK